MFPARFLKWAKHAGTIKLEVGRPTTAVACYDALRPFSMSGRWDAVLNVIKSRVRERVVLSDLSGPAHRRQLSFPLAAPKATQPCRQTPGCRDCLGTEPRRGQLILV